MIQSAKMKLNTQGQNVSNQAAYISILPRPLQQSFHLRLALGSIIYQFTSILNIVNKITIAIPWYVEILAYHPVLLEHFFNPSSSYGHLTVKKLNM